MIPRPTIRDLASRLNISPATASRALNGFPEVSSKTRRRVIDMANEIGYEPNRNAQRLAQGVSRSLGLVVTSESGRIIEPLFGDFISGIMEYATDSVIELVISPARRINELDVYRKLVAQRAVDGFIISGPITKDPRVELLQQLSFPYFVHGQTYCDHAYNWLDIDNISGFNRATKLLIDYGHKRIAFLGNGHPDMTFTQHRYQGYRQALQAQGIKVNNALVMQHHKSISSAYKHAVKLFQQKKIPTAFLCSSILIAIGVIRAARAKQLTCPKDFSIIAHDDKINYLDPQHFYPPLSTIQSSIRQAGKHCAKMLYQFINDPDKKLSQELWPVDLVMRESVGHVPHY